MTVSTTTRSVTYNGNDSTTVFAYPFRIFADSDLVVTLIAASGVTTTLALGIDYTVSGANTASGGNVTLVTAPATGEQLSIRRVLALSQPTDLRNQGAFYPETHERVFDRLLMQIQQQVSEDSLDAAIATAIAGLVAGTYDPVTATGGTTALTLADRFAVTYSPEDFGAAGDGATNDTAAFDAAVAALPEHGVLELKPGATYLLDPVVIDKALTIRGHGATVVANSATNLEGTLCFLGATTSTTTTLSAGVTDGALVLPVASTSGFAVGDWVQVKDLSAVSTDYAYEWHQIKLISGGSLYLHTPICGKWSYPSGVNGEVRKVTMIEGARVEGIRADGNNLGTAGSFAPIAFGFCVAPVALDCTVWNYRLYGITFESCVRPRATLNHVFNSSADLSTAAAPDGGYAIHFGSGTLAGDAVNNTVQGSRHAIIWTTGAKYGKALGNTCVGQYAAAISTHFRRLVDLVVEGNTVIGSTPDSFSSTTLPDELQGIVVSNTDARVLIRGNTVAFVYGPGIYCTQDALADAHLIISDNIITNCVPLAGTQGSIYVNLCRHVIVRGNQILRADSSLNWSGLRINLCEDVLVDGNDVSFSAAQGATIQLAYRIVDSKRVRVSRNIATISGASTQAFRVQSTTSGDSNDILFDGNVANVSGSGVGYVVDSNATNVRWSGMAVVGNWTATNIAASQAATEATRTDGRHLAAAPGSIVGIVVTLGPGQAVTAGNLTAEAWKGTINTSSGARTDAATGLTAVLNTTYPAVKRSLQAKDLDSYAAGDELFVKFTTDGSFLPSGSAEVSCALLVVPD